MKAEAPLHQASQIASIAKTHGADVEQVGTVTIAGKPYAVLDVSVDDNLQALRLLNALALDDAIHGQRLRELAQGLHYATGRGSSEAYARKCHRFVRDDISFVDDAMQVFRSSDATLAMGVGNCVNTARLLCALFLTGGLQAKAVPVLDRQREITHTAAQVKISGVWQWAEATIGAQFGEEPHAAARRLGIEVARTDISG